MTAAPDILSPGRASPPGDGARTTRAVPAAAMRCGGDQSLRPLAIDLFCGLGGWTEGLLAEGYEVVGYDIEAHAYGDERYPATLRLQDVLTLNGADLADADMIVASPPCQEFSYMAMPWARAKQIARALRGEDEFPAGYKGSRSIEELTVLFNACFRIQREASEAAGRYIPMVVENVRGAQPWVGRAVWNFGSFYLWGDVPALVPNAVGAVKAPGLGHGLVHPDNPRHTPGLDFTRLAGAAAEGRKGAGAVAEWFDGNLCQLSSKSSARKAASARIAKIPLTLSTWIARVYRPVTEAA